MCPASVSHVQAEGRKRGRNEGQVRLLVRARLMNDKRHSNDEGGNQKAEEGEG